MACLGFHKGGQSNFRWPLVLTQRRPNHVFLFLLWRKKYFPQFPPQNTPLIQLRKIALEWFEHLIIHLAYNILHENQYFLIILNAEAAFKQGCWYLSVKQNLLNCYQKDIDKKFKHITVHMVPNNMINCYNLYYMVK